MCGVHLGVRRQDHSRKINSLEPHLGGRELCSVLKYRTSSLGDGDASKVSQKRDPVRTKLKKTSEDSAEKETILTGQGRSPRAVNSKTEEDREWQLKSRVCMQ